MVTAVSSLVIITLISPLHDLNACCRCSGRMRICTAHSPPHRIFSPIREVYVVLTVIALLNSDFKVTLTTKNQTADHCSIKPTGVSLGRFMLKNPSLPECYAVSTDDTAVTLYQSTRLNLYQHLRIPHLAGSFFLCAPSFYSAASITLEVK